MAPPDKYITREEFANYQQGWVARIENMEDFLFGDPVTGKTKDGYLSLRIVTAKANQHIDIMCAWSRGIKILGGLAGAIVACLALLGHLLGLF